MAGRLLFCFGGMLWHASALGVDDGHEQAAQDIAARDNTALVIWAICSAVLIICAAVGMCYCDNTKDRSAPTTTPLRKL